jgi:hypothetical protein
MSRYNLFRRDLPDCYGPRATCYEVLRQRRNDVAVSPLARIPDRFS